MSAISPDPLWVLIELQEVERKEETHSNHALIYSNIHSNVM